MTEPNPITEAGLTNGQAAHPRQDLIWLGLIVIVGALLRAWGLSSWQWEQDELYTLRDARALDATPDGAPGIAGRPLYYLLQHLLLAILPPTPLALRLPAFAFGVLGIAAAWWLGRRVFGRDAGFIAAALVAVSPWHLYASQFARYWTLVFLLSSVVYGLLPWALETGTKRHLLTVLGALILGMATHPTFLFPLPGVVLALYAVDPSGRIGWRWPTRSQWLYLWGPFLAIASGAYITLKLRGLSEALGNLGDRGILASMRLIPAMIQWTPLETAAAAAAAAAFLLATGSTGDRRWGLMSILGGAGAVLLLFVSSFLTGVYADYGISVLPLLYVCVGGATQRVAEAMPERLSGWVTGSVAGVLVLGAAPGAISQLSDGSRFDYRSAYEAIRELGPDRPVAGGIDALQEAFAPELKTMRLDDESINGVPGFWFIASFQRYGLRGVNTRGQRWINRYCQRVAAWERPRLDYRVYRVELFWCGSDPIPAQK